MHAFLDVLTIEVKVYYVKIDLNHTMFTKKSVIVHMYNKKELLTNTFYLAFLTIGHGNRDHETSSNRGRLKRFTTYLS